MLLKNSKPEHGEVFIDGQNLNNVSKSSVQKNLSVAQKNGLLFNHLTIYENLIYENPQASINDVENVMKICGIWDKLTQ